MKKPFLRHLLALVFTVLFLIGCDHRVVDPSPLGQFRLASVNFQQPNSVRASIQRYTLTYNTEGELAAYTYAERLRTGPNQNEYVITGTYAISRDAQRRVDRVRSTSSRTAANAKYVYNSNGALYQIIYNSPTFDKDYVIIGEEEAVSYTFAYTGSSITPVSRRNTTSTGYVSRNASEAYVYENGNAILINNTSYTYDDKPNPYYGLLGLNTFLNLFNNPQFRANNEAYENSTEFADVQIKLFNKNNITTNTRQITYNADGLVARIDYTNGNWEEFTYERKP